MIDCYYQGGNAPNKETATMDTTTHTFTYTPSADYRADMALPEVIAQDQFRDAHRFNEQTRYDISVDMTTATVEQTSQPHITNSIRDNNGTTVTTTYTVAHQWVVRATDRNGLRCVVRSRGSHTKYRFDTEIEATKFMRKMQKTAAKWHTEEQQRQEFADHARRVCGWDPMSVNAGSDINPVGFVGVEVRVHQMGKWRVGVIVDQTPTKWVVVYTTPSNPNTIRTTTVAKG